MEFSLTVCIPAYNEAQNIERVLRAVLAQKERGFVLSEVLVYSDASLDKTAEIARGIGDKRIKVLEGQRRAGKASAINHMLRIATSDAVLLLDADSVIKSSEICNKLVSCMGQEGASLVSGSSKPLPAKTFMQKFLVFGVEAWQDLINRTPNSDMYRCGGQMVLLRKDLYKDIIYPKTSADDVFPYIYAKEKGMVYAYEPEAEIYYKLPEQYKDYFSQQVRFLNADNSIAHIFGSEVTRKYYTISTAAKFKAALRILVRHPFALACYSVLLALPKLVVAVHKSDAGGLWKIAESTKDIL